MPFTLFAPSKGSRPASRDETLRGEFFAHDNNPMGKLLFDVWRESPLPSGDVQLRDHNCLYLKQHGGKNLRQFTRY